jgi:hypothetical protein
LLTHSNTLSFLKAEEPERAFSEGRLIVTDQRCAMVDSTLEEIMCTRQWMRHLGISSSRLFGLVA